MPREPTAGQARDFLQGARFGKQMGGAGNDDQFLFAAQGLKGLAVELNDRFIVAAHDEQRGSLHRGQGLAGKVGPAAAGDDGPGGAQGGRGHEGGGCPGAGAKKAQPELADVLLIFSPNRRILESAGQEIDVETEVGRCLVELFLLRREQVEEKGAKTLLPEGQGDGAIARAVAAAAAAMREKNESFGFLRNGQITIQGY